MLCAACGGRVEFEGDDVRGPGGEHVDAARVGEDSSTQADATVDSASPRNESGTADADAPYADAPDTDAPDAESPDADAPDTGAPDTGAPDAGAPDASMPTTVVVVAESHHLGDWKGAEGSSLTTNFGVNGGFSSAWLEIDFTPPFGPNLESPPYFTVNGSVVGNAGPFFPPLDVTDSLWQTNADGSHDYNGSFHVSLPITAVLHSGINTFTITNGRPDDDYWFGPVTVSLSY